MRTVIRVELPSLNVSESFDNFEAAARCWDSHSYSNPNTPGKIVIEQYNNQGIMMRIGNLIHVTEEGTIYVSPTLKV